MKKTKRRGIPVWLCLLLCLLAVCGTTFFNAYQFIKEKYRGSHEIYSREMVRQLEEGSFLANIVKTLYSEEEWDAIRNTSYVDDNQISKIDLPEEVKTKDVNGDGIYIEHIYAGTYEGYMMIVEDPKDVYIAINPTMGTGLDAPSLDDYVKENKAIAGINGGGFEDYGGNGNGSIPAGITIIDGKLISGGAPQPILGITKDHTLVTATMSAEEALARGIVEAVTFGPTFIYNGQVVYEPTTNLNMLNPRTAVGQKEDGTFLLLVIDGRGPSSFGAKYEDVVDIFLEYDAVMAGNLDGGNSSVMIYDGQYIHYPVSMYNSRNLPSVILVGEH
ncbi:MAG: phosphodiester glycosidase family protein [Solobacterium sp.]|nr:phosphodiester glycosidase family protein [Solobacterium sp.]